MSALSYATERATPGLEDNIIREMNSPVMVNAVPVPGLNLQCRRVDRSLNIFESARRQTTLSCSHVVPGADDSLLELRKEKTCVVHK